MLLLFDIGAVIWLVAGRTWPGSSGAADLPYRGNRGTRGAASTGYSEYERPGRFTATSPQDDEEFLRQRRARAEEQRQKHRDWEQEQGDPDNGPA